MFGAGRAGHAHARAIEQTLETRLVAVFDVDCARAESFAETHGCQAFASSDDVLKRDDIDLVMVALPNFLHERATVDGLSADDACMALMTLRNGQHVSIVHTGYKTRGVEKCEVEVSCTDGMLRFDSYPLIPRWRRAMSLRELRLPVNPPQGLTDAVDPRAEPS